MVRPMSVKLSSLPSLIGRAVAELAPADVLISLIYCGFGLLVRAALRAGGLMA
jgi:hypothetical protein